MRGEGEGEGCCGDAQDRLVVGSTTECAAPSNGGCAATG